MRVAVVGGGIAGLAAAWELVTGPGAEVVVFEPERLGGRIQTSAFCGHPVDAGADAFGCRTLDGIRLARELGLEAELVVPQASRAMLWTGSRLCPLPGGLVLGAPASLRSLVTSGILSPAGMARAAMDLVLPATEWPDDVAVWTLIAGRFGRQVAERLVDPLIGGIHAGRTEDLSAEATAPQLAQAARRHRSLLLGLRQMGGPPAGPTFVAPRGGMGRLVERLVEALVAHGVTFESAAVTEVRGENGGRVVVEPAGAFDGAVIATPAAVTSRLLNAVAPEAAGELAAIPSSSVVLVTLAYPREAVVVPAGVSGWLVPRREGRLMTACSLGSAKWPHWSDPDTMVMRVSAGRAGDTRALQLRDEDLVDRLSTELGLAFGAAGRAERGVGSRIRELGWAPDAGPRAGRGVGRPGADSGWAPDGGGTGVGRRNRDGWAPDGGGTGVGRRNRDGLATGGGLAPTAWRVSRWPEAFPQYRVGHLERVARIESSLRGRLPSVMVAGASFRGSGIPACIASGRRAAAQLAEEVRSRTCGT